MGILHPTNSDTSNLRQPSDACTALESWLVLPRCTCTAMRLLIIELIWTQNCLSLLIILGIYSITHSICWGLLIVYWFGVDIHQLITRNLLVYHVFFSTNIAMNWGWRSPKWPKCFKAFRAFPGLALGGMISFHGNSIWILSSRLQWWLVGWFMLVLWSWYASLTSLVELFFQAFSHPDSRAMGDIVVSLQFTHMVPWKGKSTLW